jgi:4-hydroxy-3-polyprenylbenzoate decarboxylase
MVVVPASMGTVGRISAGVSGNLIERVADVMLKEKRKLILVPRETPFSTIHLKNLLALDQAGALILPASPGFYQGQNTLESLVDFVVARILDQLGMEQNLLEPYEP